MDGWMDRFLSIDIGKIGRKFEKSKGEIDTIVLRE